MGDIPIFTLNMQDGAPKIAFSCLISGLTVVYGRYNELVHGGYTVMIYKPTNITGGPHPVVMFHIPVDRNYDRPGQIGYHLQPPSHPWKYDQWPCNRNRLITYHIYGQHLRPKFQGQENMAQNMVLTYLHFRILKSPLMEKGFQWYFRGF